jgi:hypothetical protein
MSLAVAAGCGKETRLAPSLARDLTRPPGGAEAPAIPLAVEPLRTQADFDRFEERHLGRLPRETLIDVYARLAESAEPGKRPEDALLLQRLALLRLGSGGAGSDRFQDAFRVADRLRSEAPESPHTAWLLGRITGLVLRPLPDGTFELSPASRDVAEKLRDHWRWLLRADPDYTGPGGESTADVQRQLEALEAALAALPPADPAAPVPAAPSLGPSPGAPASEAVVRAHADLARFERGDGAQRRAVCRERAEDAPPPASTVAEHWLDLRCAALFADAERGLLALEGLAAKGAASDPCAWPARFGDAAPAVRAGLDDLLRRRGLPACPAEGT